MMSEGGVYQGLSPVGCSFRFIFVFRRQDSASSCPEVAVEAFGEVLLNQGSEFLFGSCLCSEVAWWHIHFPSSCLLAPSLALPLASRCSVRGRSLGCHSRTHRDGHRCRMTECLRMFSPVARTSRHSREIYLTGRQS